MVGTPRAEGSKERQNIFLNEKKSALNGYTIFLKLIISVRGGHCDLSPRATKILIIPPNIMKQHFAYLLLQEKASYFVRNAESSEIDSEKVVKFL